MVSQREKFGIELVIKFELTTKLKYEIALQAEFVFFPQIKTDSVAEVCL